MEDLSGKTLGNYRIEHSSGSGGMAVIYKAVDIKNDKSVILKILHSYYKYDENVVARFLREAKSSAKLKHPNIIPIYDYGKLPDGRPYIAMALADGGSLAMWLSRHKEEKQPANPKQIGVILTQIASALDHAHKNHVIHRDVKPPNILLTRQSQVWLTDFGIARVEEEVELTRMGDQLGTPAYMSPEQVQGRLNEIGPATDVYALGVVLYEMLTGERPFNGNPQAIMHQHLHQKPAPVHKKNKSLPAELDSVLQKALAKPPAERYQRAGDLADAYLQTMGLKEELEGSALIKAPAFGVGKKLIALAAGIMLLLIALTGYSVKQILFPPPDKTSTVTVSPTATRTPTSGGGIITAIVVTPGTGTPTDTPTPTATNNVTGPPTPRPPTLLQPTYNSKFTLEQPVTCTWTGNLKSNQRFRLTWYRNDAEKRDISTRENTYTFEDLPVGSYKWMILVEEKQGKQWSPVTQSGQKTFIVEKETPPPPPPPPPGITLLIPTPDAKLNDALPIEFKWTSRPPAANQGFELVIWLEGEAPAGAHNAVEDNRNGNIRYLGGNTYSFTMNNIQTAAGVNNRGGKFLWTVRLIQLSPYHELNVQAEPVTLILPEK